MKWIAHYRKTRDGDWILYVDGEIRVHSILDPVADAKMRFAGCKIEVDGVNVDVLAV